MTFYGIVMMFRMVWRSIHCDAFTYIDVWGIMRQKQVSMTETSDYLSLPLTTASGTTLLIFTVTMYRLVPSYHDLLWYDIIW